MIVLDSCREEQNPDDQRKEGVKHLIRLGGAAFWRGTGTCNLRDGLAARWGLCVIGELMTAYILSESVGRSAVRRCLHAPCYNS